jgi:hypothetical protein
MANELGEALECAEDSFEVLTEFHERMANRKQESFVVLEVVGRGAISEAFAWWMDDQSILIVGWQDDETLMIGVLPVGAELTPLPYYDGMLH